MRKTRHITSLLILIFVSTLSAQDRDLASTLNRASQYFLGDKDEILIQVNVWGYVQKPGQYLVPRHTDLISLISFAGGPREGANLGEIRIIREEQDRIGDNGKNGHNGGNQGELLKIDVKSYLEAGGKGSVPILKAGDTVLIGQTFGNKFSNFLGVTSIVGLMAASATLLIAINQLSR
ncbi:SLBB domain-containing protein [bacterium]|nr:SLBB domain-containing protein [bacterium]